MSKFYDNYWQSYDLEHNDFAYKWPVIKKLVGSFKDLVILDFGCGTATVTAKLIKLNPQNNYIGIYASKLAIDQAKKKLPKVKFFVVQDGQKLPIKSGRIDYLVACDTIEHVYDTKNTFLELARVIKPGGKILITTPYHGLLKNLFIVLFGFEKVFDPFGGHIRFFTKGILSRILKELNFKVIKFGYYGRFYPLPRGMYMLAEKIS